MIAGQEWSWWVLSLLHKTQKTFSCNKNDFSFDWRILIQMFKPVVFNLFHAATNFATNLNLTTPFRKFPVRHMKMQLCFDNRKSQWLKITYDITTLNKDSLIKFMYMAASVSETRIQLTPQHNFLKTRITPKCAAAFSYLIYKHSTLLRHKDVR